MSSHLPHIPPLRGVGSTTPTRRELRPVSPAADEVTLVDGTAPTLDPALVTACGGSGGEGRSLFSRDDRDARADLLVEDCADLGWDPVAALEGAAAVADHLGHGEQAKAFRRRSMALVTQGDHT